jgi:3-oxoacyl-[acyl-carrier-protein] synthase-1
MTKPLAPCALTGIAAITCVGDTALEAGGALRAGLSGVSEHPLFTLLARDPDFEPDEPARMGLVPSLPPLLPLPERLAQLSLGALRGLLADAKLTRDEASRAAWFLGLPEGDPVTSPYELARLLPLELFERAGLPSHLQPAVRELGHPTLCSLVAAAQESFAAAEASLAVLLLVDSFVDADRLAAMDHARRLRSQRSPDGVLVGEAGFALLLERVEGAEGHARTRSGRAPLALLGVPSFGDEPNTRTGEAHSTGRGLTQALRGLALPGAASTWMVSDLDGSQYTAFEWSVATTRLSSSLGDIEPHWHPLEATGDLGSATGGLQLLSAVHALRRGAAPAASAVLTSSSEGPMRAALRVSMP